MPRHLPVLGLVAVLVAGAVCAQESSLLTENGLKNPAAAAYQQTSRLETGGSYEPSPGFTEPANEKGKVPFASGALTDGMANYNSGPKPPIYAYWQSVGSAELMVRLGRPYRIDRVRVHLLNPDTPPHGVSRIEVFLKGDPLEFPEALRVGSLDPARDGWNELSVGRVADGLRLVFWSRPGRTYLTLSELEVWGQPVTGQTAAPPSVEGSDSPKRNTGGITWWAFDFGPKNSPAFAQFYVCDSHCVYHRNQGFGWIPMQDGKPISESNFGPASTDVPGLGERDRGGVSSDSLYRDLVMTSAYYHSQVRQTFAVDVPNGKYRVMTMHGDVTYGRPGKQPWWIEAEGQVVVRNPVLPPSRMMDLVFDVTVSDGQLDLTLDAADPDPAVRGFMLNGLVILPANDAAQQAFADRRLQMVRAAIQRERDQAFLTRFREVPWVETETMVPPTPTDRDRGFIGWTPNWMDMVYPQRVPTAEAVKRPCSTFATPGEYEPVVVALRALRELKGVRLVVGDLSGPNGAKISARALEVHTVRSWPQRLGSSWSTEWRVVPELLETKPEVDVPAHTSQSFWITLHVPADARAGHYEGPLRLVTADGRRWETTLKVDVLPFKLAEPERVVGMYWTDSGWDAETLDRQVRDMVEHGMRGIVISRSPKLSNVNGKLVVDTSELLAFLQHLRRLGITGPVPYNNGLDSDLRKLFPQGDFEQLFVQYITELEKVSIRPDALKLLYYPVDEIGNQDELGKRANTLCGLIRRVPTATSYITVNDYPSGEKWGQTFNIWCGNVPYTAEQEQKLLAAGHRYMRYGSAYLNDCRKARSSCGFGFTLRPAEAMYYWHYMCYNGDPYNDFDGDARDWCAVYPGENGELIPTMDWESLREGVDDLRYIATLKELAARAEHGSAAQQAAAGKARAELSAVLATDNTLVQYDFGEKLTYDQYDHLRGRLAQAITELVQALKP